MRSLRVRIALAYTALIVLAMTALGVVLLGDEDRRMRAALDARLLSEARLAGEAAAPLLAAGVDPAAAAFGQRLGPTLSLFGPDGTPLTGAADGTPPEVRAALASGSGQATRRDPATGRRTRYAAAAVSRDGRMLGVARSAAADSAAGAAARRIALVVLVAAVAAVAGAALLARIIAGSVTRPLARLRRAARGLAAGEEPPPRTPMGGGAEVEALTDAFDEMGARLRENLATLAEERSRLEGLLAASADAVLALDAGGVVRFENPAAMALLGSGVGRPFAEVARHHEISGLVRAARAGGRQVAQVRLDPRGQWVEATVSPIRGGGWAALVILHDITDVRSADTTRRDFVANVSHELRTPLAGIKAVVETLRDGAIHDPAAATPFLERVDGEIDRLVQLVEELLQLARLESGAAMQMASVRPRALLEGCIARFAHLAGRAGVSLTLEAPADLPAINADAARLEQATGNLIHNAIKFTPPGGAVTVTATHGARGLRITVADTGAGIDAADLPRIFERFYMADRARAGSGTGLGLAIVKHVVRAHGGSVDARSTPGRGAVFTITLPS